MGELKPLSEMERAACKAELQAIKEKTGWEEPDRGVTVKEGACDPEGKPIEWRFGHAPDYTLANLEYFKYKSKHHPSGSLEQVVENLVKRGNLSAATRSTPTSTRSRIRKAFFCRPMVARSLTPLRLTKSAITTLYWRLVTKNCGITRR